MSEVTLICPKIVNNMEDSLMGAAQKMGNIGALRASLSPQNGRILNLLYPERSNGTVSFEKDGSNIYPTVRLRWRQKATANSVKTSPSCSTDTDRATVQESVITISQYAEDGFRLDEAAANIICDEYDAMQAMRAGKSNLQSTVRGNKAATINGELADRIANILQTVDLNAATALVDGIGSNLLYAGSSDPQPMKFFNYNDAQQGPLRFFKQEMANIDKKHQLTGKPIIVTDSFEVINWFELVCGAACCSNAGVDYSQLINQQYEIYYSDKITDLIGEVNGVTGENVILFYPETFLTLAVDKWRNTRLAMGSNRKIANTEFGAIAVTEPSMRVADTACLQEIGSPRMTFDLRIREIDCTNDAPAFSTDFLASLLYENVTAPADGDGVTGIFHYTVDRSVTP